MRPDRMAVPGRTAELEKARRPARPDDACGIRIEFGCSTALYPVVNSTEGDLMSAVKTTEASQSKKKAVAVTKTATTKKPAVSAKPAGKAPASSKTTGSRATAAVSIESAATKPVKAATASKAASTTSAKSAKAGKAVAATAPAKAPAVGNTAARRNTTAVAAGSEASKTRKATVTTKASNTKSEHSASSVKASGTTSTAKALARKKLVKKPPKASHEERQRWIATAAYHRAEQRGFVPGYEVQDWLEAEAEINALVGKD